MSDFVQDDSASKFTATLRRRNGSSYDLTGHTVNIQYRIGSVGHPDVLATITDVVGGLIEHVWTALELAEHGVMYLEISIINGSGKVISSSDILEFDVREKVN